MAFQTLAVLFAVATPVLVAVDRWKWLQAAFPAAAAAIWSLVSLYHWQDNVARCAYTSEALSAELVKFQITQLLGLDDATEDGLKTFIENIVGLRMTEVVSWRSDFLRSDVAQFRRELQELKGRLNEMTETTDEQG
jgi:hypothetical protein